MKSASKKRLEIFIEKAEYIESLSYLDKEEEIIGFKIVEVNGETKVEFYQPDDEQRDAVLFNLRLFLQDKDEISIRRLSELYDDPGISDEWKQEHQEIRKTLNEYLDSVVVERGQLSLTYRDILNMFLYGKLGHYDLNDKSHAMYEEWIKDETTYSLVHNMFHEVILIIMTHVINISRASKEELGK